MVLVVFSYSTNDSTNPNLCMVLPRRITSFTKKNVGDKPLGTKQMKLRKIFNHDHSHEAVTEYSLGVDYGSSFDDVWYRRMFRLTSLFSSTTDMRHVNKSITLKSP